MSTLVSVPKRFAPQLVALPETGMGYWVVNVRTRREEVFQRVVIDSGYIVSVDRKKEVPFDPEDIVSFEVTHDKSAILR